MDNLQSIMNQRKADDVVHYAAFSREKLLKNLKTKLQTCFIGDISIIEEVLGYLWGEGTPEVSLTDNQRKWKAVWSKLRKEILDNGNDQIRAVENELKQYTVKWEQYKYQLLPKE